MKYILTLILVGLLGGCAIAPAGYGDQERGYNRGDGNYRDHDHNDAIYRNYSYRGEHGKQGDVMETTSS